jgi:hypothetical protein
MTATDWLAIYGALLGTALAAWDVFKYLHERTKLRVNCYVADEFTPGIGKTASNLLAYNIANVGGRPIVVTTIGGDLVSGSHFMILQQALPKTLEPGQALILSAPMPENIKSVQRFVVWDAIGTRWDASPDTVWKQVHERTSRGQS